MVYPNQESVNPNPGKPPDGYIKVPLGDDSITSSGNPVVFYHRDLSTFKQYCEVAVKVCKPYI